LRAARRRGGLSFGNSRARQSSSSAGSPAPAASTSAGRRVTPGAGL